MAETSCTSCTTTRQYKGAGSLSLSYTLHEMAVHTAHTVTNATNATNEHDEPGGDYTVIMPEGATAGDSS